MRVSVVQMDVREGGTAANLETVQRLVGVAMRGPCPPDVLVLPELWSSGYALEQAERLASPMGESEAAFLGGLARGHHVAFAGGSVLAARGGRVVNRAQVVDKSGVCIAGYDKVHLFRPMDEDRWLTGGREAVWFEMEGMRCALAVCYDIRFCEFIRRLALGGAEVLFVSAEWPMARRDHWVTLLRARAIENEMYIAACNRCGVSAGLVFAGSSMIIAPDGTVLAQAGSGEEILSADLDPDRVREVRNALPVFSDRVPEVY